jgi:SET domain-containing protein
MVEIRKSDIQGRGVFATQFIPKGTKLSCDVVLINKNLYDNFEVINIYAFPWDKDNYSICFGFASFINHSKTPNIRNFNIDKENLKDYFITLFDININNELLLDYGNPIFT